jgi:hypothetical protein
VYGQKASTPNNDGAIHRGMNEILNKAGIIACLVFFSGINTI